MALTDTAIRGFVAGDKPIKKADEKGLFLLLQPSGGKLWRLKYRFNGKEKKLGLGRYPDVSLKEARRRRDEARQKVAMGIDPGEEKKSEALAAVARAANSFVAVGNEYLDKASREGREAVTINKSRWLLSLFAPIGHRAIAEISPVELLGALKPIDDKGHSETARRMRSLASRIFRYAVATNRATSDPTSLLRGALTARKVKHHAAIIDAADFGALLHAIDGFDGYPLTKLALRLTPHVFVRPGELRKAEWAEIDLEKAVWTIPATKMKMRQPHVVPLSRQAVEILRLAQQLTAHHEHYVFSSLHTGARPMSENTINIALRRLGYASSEMTAHGFRATASTLLNESGLWNPDVIERALAHDTSSTVRGTYHRGTHLEDRKKMAQWWSDYIDILRAAAAEKIELNI